MRRGRGYLALSGMDENFENYISLSTEKKADDQSNITDLKKAIIKGMKDVAAAITRELIKENESLYIINSKIIPALNEVGEDFEKRKIYLPSLLMSAEAASKAFEVIKSVQKTTATDGKGRIILATVKGDIHDIGKNIVRLILENYGFSVTDLGKDVFPEVIASEAKKQKAQIVGLSALMTTTLPAMEESIRLIREKAPWCKIMVGGAVLTAEYAKEIGADFYGKDAISAVRFAEKVNKR